MIGFKQNPQLDYSHLNFYLEFQLLLLHNQQLIDKFLKKIIIRKIRLRSEMKWDSINRVKDEHLIRRMFFPSWLKLNVLFICPFSLFIIVSRLTFSHRPRRRNYKCISYVRHAWDGRDVYERDDGKHMKRKSHMCWRRTNETKSTQRWNITPWCGAHRHINKLLTPVMMSAGNLSSNSNQQTKENAKVNIFAFLADDFRAFFRLLLFVAKSRFVRIDAYSVISSLRVSSFEILRIVAAH